MVVEALGMRAVARAGQRARPRRRIRTGATDRG
jgi:hypothetical protein